MRYENVRAFPLTQVCTLLIAVVNRLIGVVLFDSKMPLLVTDSDVPISECQPDEAREQHSRQDAFPRIKLVRVCAR